MTLLMLAILLPLVGGVVMPLFHFQKEIFFPVKLPSLT